MSVLTDFSKIPPEVLKKAAEFGQHVHKTVEWFERGKLKLKKLDPILGIVLAAWDNCKRNNNILIEYTEMVVVSTRYKYAGTLDIIAIVNGKRSVIELKTRPYNPITDALQTAAYQQAHNEMFPKAKAIRRYMCELNQHGKYKFFEIRQQPGQPDHLQMFLCTLALKNWEEAAK